MENPAYGGWGGRFGEVTDKLHRNTVLDYDKHTEKFEAEYSLMRWFDDIQNDFAARADWCIASNYEDANHNPAVSVKEGLDLTAKAGEKIELHAEGSDPDGDNLAYSWWRYFEADTYEDNKGETKTAQPLLAGEMQLGLSRELAKDEIIDSIELSGSDTDRVSFTVPEDAKVGDTIHIIIEVQDDGEHQLKHYQRVIITVVS